MNKLTPQQKIERLAEFMGYDCMGGKWNEDAEAYEYVWFDNYSGEPHENIELWNPRTDWNHWRAVEMKVMEDEKLWAEFVFEVLKPFIESGETDYESPSECSRDMMKSTLPQRVDALIEALNSLPSE